MDNQNSNILISGISTPSKLKLFNNLYSNQEESELVFIKGNKLRQKFRENSEFRIVEFGFGIGLNFLTTLNTWEESYQERKTLYYIGVERALPSKEQISGLLSQWPQLKYKLLIENYPYLTQGMHLIEFHCGVKLLLIIDDVVNSLKSLPFSINTWFLNSVADDDHSYIRDPRIFKKMAWHSEEHATFSAFATSSAVRKGLEEAGFEVLKAKDFDGKREILIGSLKANLFKHANLPNLNKNFADKTAVVIGAGIAGASAAYALSKRGWKVRVFEKEPAIASQASGNMLGILYPRIEANWNFISKFYYAALIHLTRMVRIHGLETECDFKKYELLILCNKENDLPRFQKINNHQYSEYVKLVSSAQASQIAGVEITTPCLYIPESASLSMPKLSNFMLSHEGISLTLNTEVTSMKYKDNMWETYCGENILERSQILIIANSFAAEKLLPFKLCDIEVIRGQVTYLPAVNNDLKAILCYGGYITPQVNGYHHLGATFDRSNLSVEPDLISHQKNIKSLMEKLPNFLRNPQQTDSYQGKAGLRSYTQDRLPLTGILPNLLYDKTSNNLLKSQAFPPSLYLSICHGSRGALSAPLSGEIIAAYANSEPLSVELDILKSIDPARFLIRELKKKG